MDQRWLQWCAWSPAHPSPLPLGEIASFRQNPVPEEHSSGTWLHEHLAPATSLGTRSPLLGVREASQTARDTAEEERSGSSGADLHGLCSSKLLRLSRDGAWQQRWLCYYLHLLREQNVQRNCSGCLV